MPSKSSFLDVTSLYLCQHAGSGKSLCFACLPLIYDKLRKDQKSIVIVVSPLTALMQDQVATFTARGLCAAYIHGESGDDFPAVLNGKAVFLLMQQ